jgi:vacuolar-type H+-ATPase subunit H
LKTNIEGSIEGPTPMQEIMDDIIKVEAEAEKILQEAREKAGKIKSAAEEKAHTTLGEAKEAAQKLIHDLTGKARTEAENEYEEVVSRAKKESARFLETNSERVETMVKDIVTLIITPEYSRE